MASALRCSAELVEAGRDQASVEDEDDLFEIDLDAVSNLPPPQYCWERNVTATGSALLANCLLPISELSSAIPMVSRACHELSFAGPGNVVMIVEPMPLGKLLQLSSLGSSAVQRKDMKA